MTLKQKKKLDSRIINIKQMIADDSDRHFKAILYTTGSNFYDDLYRLRDRSIEIGEIELAGKIIGKERKHENH
ncbi:MAG: hypothetical protein Q8M94_22915, partial [Ignavibacteria bacterium]|nr:hypothetical protein [Ignavibacteria bacterium]